MAYEHSDGESTRDHVVFRISDGRHSSRHKFPVNILPRDDTPPFLVNNVALEVPEGGALRLRPADLLASDPDSADARILFRVDVPPRAGRLVSRADPRDPGEWQRVCVCGGVALPLYAFAFVCIFLTARRRFQAFRSRPSSSAS